jgi:multidrug resistance efflux pump
MIDVEEKLRRLGATVEQQRHTIEFLNAAIGGDGSLTTDNLVTVSRLENRIATLEKLLKVEQSLVKHGTKVQAKFEARITALEQANAELLECQLRQAQKISDLLDANKELLEALQELYDDEGFGRCVTETAASLKARAAIAKHGGAA